MAGNERLAVALAVSLAAAFAARDARAEDVVDVHEDPTFRRVEPERRNGVVLGFQTGVGFGGARGYPNSPRLIGDPAYYSSTPLMVGSSSSIFLMGALADWVSFGPMVSWATFENDKWRSTGFGVGFRLETFPLVSLAPALADTSLYTQLGIGSTELRTKAPGYPDADGTQSFLGVGVHHEFRLVKLLGGHLAMGPHVEYDVIRSESITRNWLTVGLRFAWYGGTVKADAR
jgi:hypothetical protein